jgi:hypothetical protein
VCEDAVAWDLTDDCLIAAIADGAGSARFSAMGAKFVVDTAVAKARELVQRFGSPFDVPEETLAGLVPDLRSWLKVQAIQTGGKLEELASTLVLAIASPRGIRVVQIGDSACVVRIGGELRVARWPDQGEFANATYFVTSADAEANTHVVTIEAPIEAFTLFSDGLLYMLLDPSTRAPHPPFFSRVFDALEGRVGECADVSRWLEEMLASPSVTSRTDDDTSLVVGRFGSQVTP